jgi:hypothetical protein
VEPEQHRNPEARLSTSKEDQEIVMQARKINCGLIDSWRSVDINLTVDLRTSTRIASSTKEFPGNVHA